MSVAILTDSTCDLSQTQLDLYQIEMIPVRVVLDNLILTDRVDISPEEVLQAIESGATLGTLPPTVAEFDAMFRRALDTADQVLAIHASAEISPTVQNAREAAQRYGALVTVHDSRSISLGLGLQVIRAAELAQQQVPMGEIISELNRVHGAASTLFTVENLRFLQLNGRISRAGALLGGLLNIKPTLGIVDGRIQAASRTLGHARAMNQLADTLRAEVGRSTATRVGFVYAPGGEPYVAELRDCLRGMSFEDIGDHMLGSAVVANAGPGTVGFSVAPA